MHGRAEHQRAADALKDACGRRMGVRLGRIDAPEYDGAMEPSDLTVRVLQEIRGELRGLRDEQREFREEQRQFREQSFARFETIETTLRDLAEQLVMLARGVRVAIESRDQNAQRLEAIEKRLEALEKRA